MANVASDIGPVDEIKDLLTCSLCSNILRDPRSLTCLHNFCKGCLGTWNLLCCLSQACVMNDQ